MKKYLWCIPAGIGLSVIIPTILISGANFYRWIWCSDPVDFDMVFNKGSVGLLVFIFCCLGVVLTKNEGGGLI